MNIIHSIRAALRHTPGLLILVMAIALFSGALGVALAHEREALRDRPLPPNGASALSARPIPRYPTPAQGRASPTPTTEAIDIPNARMNYYKIEGNSATDLRTQMNSLGPTDAQGAHADAFTDWYVSWGWPGYGTAQCDLTQVRLSYAITVTFPSWQIPAQVEPELVDHWRGYTLRLALHEKGHVDNVVKNQRSLRQAIEQATCDTAEAAARQTLDHLRDFDANYDKKTKHGATQGATFP